jgi:predicted RNase H-like nuclease
MVRLCLKKMEIIIAKDWTDLPVQNLRFIAVDMPIGLPDGGRRGCDLLAREKLGFPRQSSVFLGLRRPLLGFADYPAANAWGKADGAGLSKQAWNLLGKIRQIDAWITPARQAQVRETHPELVFQRLNGGTPPPRKATQAGLAARRALLQANGFTRLDAHLDALKPSQAKPDDLLDACACAEAARRMLTGAATRLPARPPRDARGLAMEIWF